MTQKEFKEIIRYFEELAKDVSTSKYFVVKLAFQELKNIYDQKQKIYREMKKLKVMTVTKNYNIKDNENEMIHPLIKEYRAYSDQFLKVMKNTVNVIKDLSDRNEEVSKNKLRGFQAKVIEMRGESIG